MLHILLVDDNPNDRLIATRELEQTFSEIRVTPIFNLQDLDRTLAMGHFDAVITDFQIGWTDGLKVLAVVKAKYPDCPVIMFTGSGNEEIAVQGMKAGLSDYVLKRRNIHRLSIALQESLEKWRLRRQYASVVEDLRLSEERFRLATSAAQLGTWDWHVPTDELIWSDTHERLFGLAPGTFAGTSDAFLACIHPDDRSLISQAIEVALTQQRDFQQDFRVVWADNSVHWIASRGKVFYNGNDQPNRMIGVVGDVTQQKQIEAEQARLLELEKNARTAAEAVSRMKDEFLATLSHELRSPLNAILGWAQILRTGKVEAEVVNRALETIERNARLQTQLIEDLLDVSRIIRGKLTLNITTVNLATVIAAAIDTVTPAAQAKSIQVDCHLDDAVEQMAGDPDRLQQVIWNLLSNAIKFTPTGGQVEIWLHAHPRVSGFDADFNSTAYAQITVKDTGKGIDPSFLPYVFDSFRQGDSSITRRHGGLGLGLAIVRHLVELHGGTVSAASSGEGQGATFTVLLPYRSVVEAHQLTSEKPPTSSGSQGNSHQSMD